MRSMCAAQASAVTSSLCDELEPDGQATGEAARHGDGGDGAGDERGDEAGEQPVLGRLPVVDPLRDGDRRDVRCGGQGEDDVVGEAGHQPSGEPAEHPLRLDQVGGVQPGGVVQGAAELRAVPVPPGRVPAARGACAAARRPAGPGDAGASRRTAAGARRRP